MLINNQSSSDYCFLWTHFYSIMKHQNRVSLFHLLKSVFEHIGIFILFLSAVYWSTQAAMKYSEEPAITSIQVGFIYTFFVYPFVYQVYTKMTSIAETTIWNPAAVLLTFVAFYNHFTIF